MKKRAAAIIAVLIAGTSEASADEEAHWKDGATRPFIAGTVDAGIPYAQPALFVGYGKPHWQWAGAEVRAGATATFAHAYAGVRAALPFVDAAVGVRDTHSFRWSLLEPRDAHEGADGERLVGPNARYRALDVELSGVLPVPFGFLVWDALLVRTLDVGANHDVYDESLRAIVRPPVAGVGRLAYLATVGRTSFGPAGEIVVLPRRNGPVVRAGALVSVRCTEQLDVLIALTMPVTSPDSLSLVDASSGLFGIRYRWSR